MKLTIAYVLNLTGCYWLFLQDWRIATPVVLIAIGHALFVEARAEMRANEIHH